MSEPSNPIALDTPENVCVRLRLASFSRSSNPSRRRARDPTSSSLHRHRSGGEGCRFGGRRTRCGAAGYVPGDERAGDRDLRRATKKEFGDRRAGEDGPSVGVERRRPISGALSDEETSLSRTGTYVVRARGDGCDASCGGAGWTVISMAYGVPQGRYETTGGLAGHRQTPGPDHSRVRSHAQSGASRPARLRPGDERWSSIGLAIGLASFGCDFPESRRASPRRPGIPARLFRPQRPRRGIASRRGGQVEADPKHV